jgi:cytochrome c2
MLPPGPFTAKFSGYLKVALRGDFQFRLEAKGKARLLINTKEVQVEDKLVTSETIELAKGYNKVEVEFTSPIKGDAQLRVFWMGEGFAWEPLPPDMLFARGDDPHLVEQSKIREGRHLFGRLECAHCHALPEGVHFKDAVLPELQHRAPLLTSAGHRLQEDWLAAWVLNPHALRPEATMPRLLSGPDTDKQAADLAAYLGTLKEGKPPEEGKRDKALAARGALLFESIGCVTCHRVEDPAAENAYGRLSLFHVASKYRPGALRAFLKQPHEHYPWSRMPDFKLKEDEADALTCWKRPRAP